MFRIFADRFTKRKVAAIVKPEDGYAFLIALNEKFGGNWVFVDTIDPSKECILFEDDFEYKGYSPEIERYSTAIKTI